MSKVSSGCYDCMCHLMKPMGVVCSSQQRRLDTLPAPARRLLPRPSSKLPRPSSKLPRHAPGVSCSGSCEREVRAVMIECGKTCDDSEFAACMVSI